MKPIAGCLLIVALLLAGCQPSPLDACLRQNQLRVWDQYALDTVGVLRCMRNRDVVHQTDEGNSS